MQNTLYSNILHFSLNEKKANGIAVKYTEDLESIGTIKQSDNPNCRPYLDTEYGRMIIDVELSFSELEHQILSYLDNQSVYRKQKLTLAAVSV